MAIDSEPKRWAMHALASSAAIRNTVFNPDTSGLVAIERATVLRYGGSIDFDNPAASTAARPPAGLALLGVGT